MPTRRSLLSRLKDWEDQQSWREFFNLYRKLIYAVAIKTGLSDAEAQDAVQETFVSVAKKMRKFKYDPARSFKGWLLQLTRWRILNQIKKRPREVPLTSGQGEDTDRTPTVERVPDPASLNLDAYMHEEWQRNLVDAAVQRVRQKVNPRHYQVFHLHVLKHQPAQEVARALNVSLAQVYIIKHRLSALVKKEVRSLERKMI